MLKRNSKNAIMSCGLGTSIVLSIAAQDGGAENVSTIASLGECTLWSGTDECKLEREISDMPVDSEPEGNEC